MTYYGDRFAKDIEAFGLQIKKDIEGGSDLDKVRFVVQARAMFFGNLALLPEPMKAALQTCLEAWLVDLPFTMDDVRPSTPDFPMAISMLMEGVIPITRERAVQLIDILNIGAK